jgi:hypothetical protein
MLVNLKNLFGKLNQTTRSLLEAAAGLCLSRTHYDIEVEHFLVKLLGAQGTDFDLIAKYFGIDRSRLTVDLNRSLDRLKTGNARTPAFSPSLADALSKAWVYGSVECGATMIRTGFVLAALLAEDELSRLVGSFTRELQKIDAAKLRSDWAAIVGGSDEDALAPEPEGLGGARELTGGPRVFISYRREDSSLYAYLLYVSLLAGVRNVAVFRDSDTLKAGMEFSKKIPETLAECDILLAIIGKKWLGIRGDTRRIDLSEDWVRLEVAAAFEQKKLVIPCLVGGAKMPGKDKLPADIAKLSSLHCVSVS